MKIWTVGSSMGLWTERDLRLGEGGWFKMEPAQDDEVSSTCKGVKFLTGTNLPDQWLPYAIFTVEAGQADVVALCGAELGKMDQIAKISMRYPLDDSRWSIGPYSRVIIPLNGPQMIEPSRRSPSSLSICNSSNASVILTTTLIDIWLDHSIYYLLCCSPYKLL